MSGIAGALDLTGQREFPPNRLRAMTAAIAHRGPDGERVHFEPGLALGSRRLATIDREGGRQLVANEDGSILAAADGVVVNHPEIRQSLLDRGHRLATGGDAEAWPHLYEDRGERLFEAAKGQFAVALWDRKTRTLILGRDRVGICPLYYAEAEGWLIFGSEIKALLASGMIRAEADVRGIDHLFTFFSGGTTRTFFEGVKSIPPGHYLKVQHGEIARKLYWDLDFPDAGAERRPADPTPLIEELQAKLEESVSRRLRSDVPIVAYISGGLDSTVVLGLSNRLRQEPLPTFTIGFDKAGPDERSHSAEAAAMLGSPLTTVVMNHADIGEAFPELITAAEGPVLDTSCAALLRLAQAASGQGYRVAVTGEGSDEAFGGYVWFKWQRFRDGLYKRVGRTIPRLVRDAGAWTIAGGRMAVPDELAVRGVRPAQQDMYEMVAQAKPILYSAALQSRLAGHNPYSDLDITNDRIGRWDPLNQSLYVGYKVMLAGLLLISKGDRITMNASLEARCPFLDDDVIEFASGIAPEYKLRGRTEKWILRQVAARILPKQIADRPKTMFRSSLSGTFLNPQRPAWVDQLLSPESLRKTGYFDPAAVARQRWWQTTLPRVTLARFIFDVGLTCVASTQLWHHIFLGGGLCDLPTWSPPVGVDD